ncbi:NmrA family NAD(P)-binding protein [Streptomyces sp. QH1-20]|uniref:NmrA family NAD(P)-binding protein n=1 Tax=Streptomyces sp. QH1-20 TaxID=3240934 RepID=UPI0035178EB5
MAPRYATPISTIAPLSTPPQPPGLGHIVLASVAHADRDTGVPHYECKHLVEQHLRAAGVPWTGTASAAFMDNYAGGWILAAAIGRPITQEVPLPDVRARSAGLAAMCDYFTTSGLDADVARLRRDHPDIGWHSFADWAAGQD